MRMGRGVARGGATLLAVVAANLASGLRPPLVHAQGHEDLFHTAPPRSTPIFDPRLEVERIRYSPIGGKVVIQGDISLGTVQDVARRSLELAARFAERALKDQKIAERLSDDERRRLGEVAGLKPAAMTFRDDQAAEDEVERVLDILRDLKLAPSQKTFEQATFIRSGLAGLYRWPGGIVPFEVAEDCLSQEAVRKAITYWNRATDRIRLVEIQPGDKGKRFRNWVRFVRADMPRCCRSQVGMNPLPGEQPIEISDGCGEPQVAHEIGHAVGFFHEQCRKDRDKWIEIVKDNLKENAEPNFEIVEGAGTTDGPLDFRSLFLYPAMAYAKLGKVAIVPRPGVKPELENWGIASGQLGGSTTGLSAGDLEGIKAMYPNPAKLPE